MERQRLNTDYLRTQFQIYWPRVQRAIMPMIERLEMAAREFMNKDGAAPRKRRATKARRPSARRTRVAN